MMMIIVVIVIIMIIVLISPHPNGANLSQLMFKAAHAGLRVICRVFI